MTILLSFLFAFYVSSAENQKSNNENKIIKTQNILKKDSSTNWGEYLTHAAEGGTLAIFCTGTCIIIHLMMEYHQSIHFLL